MVGGSVWGCGRRGARSPWASTVAVHDDDLRARDGAGKRSPLRLCCRRTWVTGQEYRTAGLGGPGSIAIMGPVMAAGDGGGLAGGGDRGEFAVTHGEWFAPAPGRR
jgi:hypothetical protein